VETAKHGISTTTPGDAGAGAIKGAEIGLALGVLATIASLILPGVGFVAGGGALATAIGGLVGTTAAGAIAGGAYGFLKDQGVPEQAAAEYHHAVQGGGAVIAIQIPSGNLDRAAAEQLIAKYGGSNVNSYGGAIA